MTALRRRLPRSDSASFLWNYAQPDHGGQGNTPERCGGVNREIDEAEATGVGSASSINPSGQCRIPFPDLRTNPAVLPRWPSRREASARPRYHTRARKLTSEQESAVRALAGSKSLRSLAADFGVSHETIRAVVRQ